MLFRSEGKAELSRLSGISLKHIGVLPNGIDTELYCPADLPTKVALRKQLGLPIEKLAVVIVARLAPEKNIGCLIRAFQQVVENIPAAELWIAGYGPEQRALEDLTAQLQLRSHVRFLGKRSDVPQILRAADLFALSSFSEGLSVALIEAAACGLPIVATDVEIGRAHV